ncbi:hypothetical protein H8A95_39245 [Bradyrhizobium sp. Pear76]|uniref:hypothetical protein n=1 Tax=Bradyrhizobium oropedii TaxID=1571201 RepID=UPI001E3C2E98|nr:hypothetical protein [Bradyrhizobium oropedii]MCC8968184.1 hypothetical protein [Bradyrhizobium oropedii]
MTLGKLIHVTLRHFQNRLFELATSWMMIALSVHILAWPDSIRASVFRFILQVTGPTWMVIFFGAGGVLRLAALVANGSWPYYGPKLRACGAFIGASVWAQMCTSLFLYQADTGNPPSPGIWVYLVLSMVELIAMCRALVDHGRVD